MKSDDIFDNEGRDGDQNARAFARLPGWMQETIQASQYRIQQAVEQRYPGVYIPVSGFRSDQTNRWNSGVVGSLHLFGLARDFRSRDSGYGPPALCPKRFKVIASGPDGRTWHVEVK